MKAEIQAIFVDTFARMLNVLKSQSELPHLKFLIYFNELTPNERYEIERIVDPNSSSIQVISLNELAVINDYFSIHVYFRAI